MVVRDGPVCRGLARDAAGTGTLAASPRSPGSLPTVPAEAVLAAASREREAPSCRESRLRI